MIEERLNDLKNLMNVLKINTDDNELIICKKKSILFKYLKGLDDLIDNIETDFYEKILCDEHETNNNQQITQNQSLLENDLESYKNEIYLNKKTLSDLFPLIYSYQQYLQNQN